MDSPSAKEKGLSPDQEREPQKTETLTDNVSERAFCQPGNSGENNVPYLPGKSVDQDTVVLGSILGHYSVDRRHHIRTRTHGLIHIADILDAIWDAAKRKASR